MSERTRAFERREAFGSWVKEKRRAQKLSQGGLALRLGWPHKSAVSNIETGKVHFPPDKLLDLSAALGVEFMEVLDVLKQCDQNNFDRFREQMEIYARMNLQFLSSQTRLLDDTRRGRKGVGRKGAEIAQKQNWRAFRPEYPSVDRNIYYQTLEKHSWYEDHFKIDGVTGQNTNNGLFGSAEVLRYPFVLHPPKGGFDHVVARH